MMAIRLHYINISNQQSEVLVTQSYPTVCDPMDYSPPGSSVHGILQARILECIAIPFSRGSFQPSDQTQVFYVSWIACRFFIFWATREGQEHDYLEVFFLQHSVWLYGSFLKIFVMLFLFVCLFVWLCCMDCRILVPWPGIEPGP